MISYTVKPGECMRSIGALHRCDWEMLWDLPENAPLRDKRDDPNVLEAGDVVFIPAEAAGTTSLQGRRHTFKTTRSVVRVRLMKEGEPMAGQEFSAAPWVHHFGPEPGYFGDPVEGTTDGEGLVLFEVAASTRRVRLRVGPLESAVEYELGIGLLDPPDTPNGFRQRLANLGTPCPRVDSEDFAVTVSAFQTRFGLSVTGEVDASTADQIRAWYGS